MTSTPLRDLLVERLTAPDGPAADVGDLVLAAADGDEVLERALAGETAPLTSAPAPADGDAPGVYVAAIEVAGFRGVGPPARLEVAPGPGLTLVVGRNGSGKSSFAEGLELVMTGRNHRWSGDRSKVWSTGWRNLHTADGTRISAELVVEGHPDAVVLARRWGAEDDLGGGTRELSGLGGLGEGPPWAGAVESHRPFLSYNELGETFDVRPSELYDRLAGMLGLGALTDALERLRQGRLERANAARGAREMVRPIREDLAGLNDERATGAAAALEGRTPDLDALGRILSEGTDDSGEGEIGTLRALASLTVPSNEAVAIVCDELREAGAGHAALAATDAARADRLAGLLRGALEFHEHDGPVVDCPVCGRADALDTAWRQASAAEAERLEREAGEARAAVERLRSARDSALALVSDPPEALDAGLSLGIPAEPAIEAWTGLLRAASAEEPPERIAAGVQDAAAALDAALVPVREAAEREVARREDRWRPVAERLREWLSAARAVAAEADQLTRLKAAEDWMRDAVDSLRAERFRPIADRAAEAWGELRQQSNVSIESLTLDGTGNRRKVDLAVTVDGTDASALGVMSQGELHSLALCLFLPRATLPESPFRFVVIDDPVQAMDPGKVEGLARVLGKVAALRQVVVFTHDERLPEAARRLRIPHDLVEVARRAGSAVSVVPRLTPAESAFADARAAARDDGVPPAIATTVALSLCRTGIEAAAADVVRRHRAAAGVDPVEIDAELTHGHHTLLQRLAVAIFDDKERAGDVMRHVNAKHGTKAGDALKLCNKGAHGEARLSRDQLKDVVRQAEGLARSLAADG